jgi:queuosine precursor transporter
LNNNYIRSIIIVVGLYLFAQIIADVTAFKMVEFFGITLPAGTFVYALTFTKRDLAHKTIGKKNTIFLIWFAAAINVFMAVYFLITIYLPSPVWFEHSQSYATVLGLVPRIVFASIIAEVLSQLADTFIYQSWWERFPKAPQWSRVLISNCVGVPIDSALFSVFAFYRVIPLDQLFSITLGQIIFKYFITIISLPTIYLVKQNPEFDLL